MNSWKEVAACALVVVSCSQGWPEATSEITAPELARHISTLASDEFAGRAPGTDGEVRTIDYIVGEFERIGVLPAFDGTYFQDVPLVDITLEEDTSSFAVGPRGEMASLDLGGDSVFWTKRVVEDVSVEASDLVFVGYGAVAPEYGWNDYAGLDATGKTVVMLVNDPGYATQDPDLFSGNAMTYYGRWTYKFEEAARQGADAAIIVHETEPASYGWDTVRNSWTGPQIDLDSASGASRVAVEAWITREVAAGLFAEAGLDFEALRAAARTPGFRPVPMAGLQASATLHNRIRRMTSPNVVGVLEGSERPDEYVLYTAHWDHLGVSDDPGVEDRIFNGAVDNATGVAALVEIAEGFAVADPAPRRSVLFAIVTAEKSGLLGSAYFAERPPVPLRNVAGGINIDALLPTGRSRDIVVVGYGASELEDMLATAAAEQGRTLQPDPRPEAGFYYRSDHVNLAKHGVPMLYADNGEDLIDGGVEAGRAFADAYRDGRYHQPADEYHASWNLEGMVEDVRLLYAVGSRLAETEQWPNWYDGHEFRAVRDASRIEE